MKNADAIPIQPIHLNFLETILYASTAPLPVLRPMASSLIITMKPVVTPRKIYTIRNVKPPLAPIL